MTLKAEYIIGTQKDNEWSAVYGYRPEEGTPTQSEIFITVRIAVEKDEYSLENIAKILLDELQGSYFTPKKDYEDNMERLEDSVWKMKAKMEYILSREPNLSKEGLDIEMAIAVFEDNILYLAVIGESKIYIKRGEKFVDLSKGLVDVNQMGFFKTGSIELREDDRLFLGTSKSIEKGVDVLQSSLDELNISKLDELKEVTGSASLILADEAAEWFKIQPKESTPEQNELVENDLVVQEENPNTDEVPVNKSLDDMVEEETLSEEGKAVIQSENIPQASPEDEQIYTENITATEKIKGMLSNISKKASEGVSQLSQKLSNIRKPKENEFFGETHTIEDDVEEGDSHKFTNYVMNEETEDIEEVASDDRMSNIANRANLAKNRASHIWQSKLLPVVKSSNKTYMKILKDIWARLKVLLDKLLAIFKEEIIGTNDRRDRVMRAKRRRRNRIVLAVVVVVLLVLIYSGLKTAEDNRQQQERIDTANAQLTNLKNKLNTLTPQVLQSKNSDDQKKTLILNELEKLSSDIDLQKRDGLFVDELTNLSKQVQSSEDELLLVTAVTDPKIVTDVGKNYPDATLSDIVYSNGNLFVSDSSRGVVYKVGATALNAQPQAYVTGLTQPYLLVRDVNNDIIFYDNDTTSVIGKFSPDTDPTVKRFPSLTPASVGKPIEAALYDGNNALYEIRQTTKQIFRRNQDGENYVAGGAAPSTDPSTDWRDDGDFANALDISVPRDIFVLIKNQGLKRYLAGGDNTLTFASFTNLLQSDYDSMKSASSMDVADNNIVVADPVNRRVLLFKYDDSDDSKINFVKQYVYRGSDSTTFSDLDEVVVVQKESAIYVLDGTKVIRLDM